jgi:hypothetical protein
MASPSSFPSAPKHEVPHRHAGHAEQRGPVGESANDGLVWRGQLVDANMLVNREAGSLELTMVLPHKHKLLLKGLNRKVSRRSVAAAMFHELMLAFMDEFRNVQ